VPGTQQANLCSLRGAEHCSRRRGAEHCSRRPTVLRLMRAAFAAVVLVAAVPRVTLAFDNGAPHSRLPPLGWSSWDALAAGADHPIRDFCDTVSVKAAADAYIEAGLYDAGYRHLHLDDCWAGKTRNATGYIQPDATRFPRGMKEVVDYVHSKNLTFGLYTSAGKTVCVGGRVGSQGHWKEDAQVFAEWGVDWVKMDWCGGASDVHGSYQSMSKALNESGRHIALNMCRGDLRPWGWIDEYAQSWRVTEDHSGKWSQASHGIKEGIATAMAIPREATGRPYGWNDMDMLQTGTGPASGFDPTLGPPNVTMDESVTEFSMWAILASPMLFTTPIMNCTAAASTPPVAAPPSSPCACTSRLSKADCVEGKTFGCLPNGSMWAVGCRGTFTCNGIPDVHCNVNTPDPPRNHTCKCQRSPSPAPSPSPGSPPMSSKHCKAYLNDVQRKILLNKGMSTASTTRMRAAPQSITALQGSL
jgi:alpha-galactosidase